MPSKHARHAKSLVLSRTNYGETDRIATLLTDTDGKVKVIVKGARKHGSKLAAGVELFSVSEVGYIPGRGELATLVSARLVRHYTKLLASIDRVDFAYGALKHVHTLTEQSAEARYFTLTEQLLAALDNLDIAFEHTQAWWYVQLLQTTGHAINTRETVRGESFVDEGIYLFDQEHGGFADDTEGSFSALHIKYIRLCERCTPLALERIQGGQQLAADIVPTFQSFVKRVH